MNALKEKKRLKKRGILFAVIAVLVLAVAYLMACAMADPQRILPNMTVNGVSLGGMTLEEAVDALKKDTDARRGTAKLIISADGKSYSLELGDLLGLDCTNLAGQTLSYSQQSFAARGLFWLWDALFGLHIENFPAVTDSGSLHKRLEDSGLLDIDSTVQTTYEEKNGQLVFTMGITGEATDEAALTEEITAALEEGDYETVITCPMTSGTVEPLDMDAVYQDVHKKVADASLDPKHSYRLVKSVRGVDFDKEAAKKAVSGLEEGATAAVELVYTEPKITTRDMKKHLFRDRLATHTTRVGGTAGRIANIKLAAAKCNGTILLAGDTFSFNNTVGEQKAETGFHKASAIQGRKIIQAYGGGICQVSTTLFIPALYAGLEIPERWCHNYVSTYAKAGMDAAVAWGGLDFQIKNDRKYPIKLEVYYANGSLTATIWGTKTEKTKVEVDTKVLSSSGEILEVQTTRKIYAAGSENAVISRFYSSYLNPSQRQY